MQGPWKLLTGLFHMACSAGWGEPRALAWRVCRGGEVRGVPPTMDWALPHQSSGKCPAAYSQILLRQEAFGGVCA